MTGVTGIDYALACVLVVGAAAIILILGAMTERMDRDARRRYLEGEDG